MKKILSILSAISLSTIITTNIIACKLTSENNKLNKPIEHEFIPQQPPENSNWKLNDRSVLTDNKWYIAIVKKKKTDDFSIVKFNFSNESIWSVGAPYHTINGIWYIVSSFYQWQKNNEPITPTINNDTGEITNWNEKIES